MDKARLVRPGQYVFPDSVSMDVENGAFVAFTRSFLSGLHLSASGCGKHLIYVVRHEGLAWFKSGATPAGFWHWRAAIYSLG